MCCVVLLRVVVVVVIVVIVVLIAVYCGLSLFEFLRCRVLSPVFLVCY